MFSIKLFHNIVIHEVDRKIYEHFLRHSTRVKALRAEMASVRIHMMDIFVNVRKNTPDSTAKFVSMHVTKIDFVLNL